MNEGHFFSTESGQIYYELLGEAEKPPLILLHNFMSSGRAAWGPMLSGLTQHYRVILPDMPGHGRSVGHPAGFEHVELARQIGALLHSLGAQRAHLAGASSGGMVAQLMVHHHFAHPRTLTLVSTTYSTNPATTGVYHGRDPVNFQAGPRWLEATARLHDPHHYPGYFDQVLLAGFRQLDGRHTIDLPLVVLAYWSLPVCLIHGDQDEFFGPEIVQEMQDALPDREMHLIPNQTHALILRQPQTVQRLLLDFLTRRGHD